MITIKDYILYKKIGKGSYGEVFLTQKENDPKKYATKKIDISKFSTKDAYKYLNNEIKIMKQLDHENIIKLYEFLNTGRNIYLVMDYINGGSLSDFLSEYKLKTGKPFPQKAIQHFVKQIVQALIHIHSKNIIHRDIKLDNILVNFPSKDDKENLDYSKGQIKIIDFGLSTQANLAKSAVGSPLYMDPIILEKYKKAGGMEKFKSYDKKADIWSLGVITYEMLTGENLFKAVNIDDLIQKVEKGDYSLEVKNLTNEIISFLNCMLQKDPNKRLPATELAKHQFLTGNPDLFKKIDTSQINYKIKNGMITLNVINNETIGREFPFNPNDYFKSLTINLELISDKFSKEKEKEEMKEDKPIADNDIKSEKKNDITKLLSNPDTRQILGKDTTSKISKDNTTQPIKKFNSDKFDNPEKKIDQVTPERHNFLSEKNLNKIKKEYEVKFQVSRTDNKKQNININIDFLVNEKNTLNHEANLKEENSFKDEWTWKFNSNDWKNIDNNNDYFIMSVNINKANSDLKFNVEKIKLGKPISLFAKKYIKIELTPIIKDINI